MSQLDGHTDLATLVRAASEGDSGGLERHHQQVHQPALVGRPVLPAGLRRRRGRVQNTWLRLLENLTKIDNPEALPGWLATTARREALGILRRRGRTVLTRDEDLGVDPADPASTELDSALLEDERDVELWASFAQLPERCQQLLRVLMAVDRPVYAEVSAAFDMPIGSDRPDPDALSGAAPASWWRSPGTSSTGRSDRPREARS